MSFCYCFCNSVFLLLISFGRCLAFKQLVPLMKDVSCERTCLQSASEDWFTCVIFSVSGLEVLSLLTVMNCSDRAFCKDKCLSRCRRDSWSSTPNCKTKQCHWGINFERLILFPSAEIKRAEAINTPPPQIHIQLASLGTDIRDLKTRESKHTSHLLVCPPPPLLRNHRNRKISWMGPL